MVSTLDFHKGRALLQIAKEYPTLLENLLEQVQNAIDADATRIGVLLNKKTRRVVVTDNGHGVSKEDFEQALQHVCSSQKAAGKLGRFGIGLISPLGKCVRFKFASCPKNVPQGYLEWTFDTAQIAKQSDEVSVPSEHHRQMAYRKNAQGMGTKEGSTMYVPWRTRVTIEGYSEDKLISRLGSIDSLIENILQRFGTSMRRKNVLLSVRFTNEDGSKEERENIKPVSYTGKRLERVFYTDLNSGQTTFELYLAQKTTKGYNGKIVIGEADNDYRFPWSSFIRAGNEYLPRREVLEALSSGIFEGEITSSGCTLHSNRKNFERNDAFVEFCVAVEKWYDEHGEQYLAKVREASEEARYQDLGLRSLATLENLLKDPRFKELREVIHGFKKGTVGAGQVQDDPDGDLGLQDEPSLTTTSLNDDEGESKAPPKKGQPTKEPYSVTGPRGQRRKIVNNGSLGLQFSHIPMEGSDRLYELDARLGVLHFNIRHPDWVKCWGNDRQVMQLQEYIALEALNLLTVPLDWKSQVELALDQAHSAFVYLIQNSGAFRPGLQSKVAAVD